MSTVLAVSQTDTKFVRLFGAQLNRANGVTLRGIDANGDVHDLVNDWKQDNVFNNNNYIKVDPEIGLQV